MLRNYLMPGFALILLAVFAGPRSVPVQQPEARTGTTKETPSSRPASSQPTASAMPAIGGTKPLLDPAGVCALARTQMHEKLAEFNLDYPDPEQPAATETTVEKAQATEAASEAMIALVPDPIHTHLALLFDRYIDVVQQALQDSPSEDTAGWIYVSQWLPWDPVPYQAAQDPVDRTNTRLFDANRECAPGFLVFRKNQFQDHSIPGKFLIVFLVGESPTSGILHPDQFMRAVGGWGATEQRDHGPARGTLRLLGPTFSATLLSLNALLQTTACGPGNLIGCERTQVVSGSVSVSRHVLQDSKQFSGLVKANFVSVLESADFIQELLLKYFWQSESLLPSQVAFISEDETASGNLFSFKMRASNKDRPLLFHYPREISRLRNAYEKNSVFSRQSTQQANAQNQQDLTLSLEDRHEEEDSVPSFSDTQSPISQESALSALTRAVDRENIRVAVVNGTDVLDVIFVARYLARNLPNVRVILLNADLLFERSPDVGDFRGMLMANTYPLIPENIQWSGRFVAGPLGSHDPFGTYVPERIFSAHETPGIYNAIRILEKAPFDIKGQSIDLTRNGQTSLLLPEYTDPFGGGSRPSLWLNAIGRGGFWPVGLLGRHLQPLADDTNDVHTSLPWITAGNSTGRDSIPPGMFDRWGHPQIAAGRLILSCILSLTVLFSIALCAFARLDWGPEYVFDIPDTNRRRRAWLVLVIILCQSWIARILILDLPPSAFFSDRINCGMLVLELVLLIFAMWLIAKALPTPRPYWAWGIMAAVIMAELMFHVVQPQDFAPRIFYLYRSQHPFSGVCPVLPYIFLFIALAGLLFRHIHSLLIFSKLIKPRVPSHRNSSSPPLLCFVTADHVENIFRACYSPWRMLYSKLRPGYSNKKQPGGKATITSPHTVNQAPAKNSTWLGGLLIPASLTLLVVTCMLFPHGLETFETRAHAIWLTIFAAVIVVMMLLEIGWVILMWVNLQNGLLVPLERTTLRACFSRVSGFSWHRLWFSIDLAPAVRFKPLSRAYESMQRIVRDNYSPANVKVLLTDACQKHDEMLAQRDPGELARAFSTYQDSLCQCATQVIGTILSDVSRQKEPLATSLDVPANEIEKVMEESAKADSLEANAEEFVGLIYIYAIQHVLMDIRSHILAFTFSYLFLIFALSAYPVAPHHSIMVVLIGLFAGFVIAIVTVFSQMHRDSILSRTTSTEPGKLDLGFYEKLISVLGVPLIGLLASQFPEISNFLFSWLEPSLQTLK